MLDEYHPLDQIPQKAAESPAAMTESRETRIRRLIHRSSYTGTRETDRLLGAFARAQLPGLDDAGLDAYEELLAIGDPEIWGIASGMRERPAGLDNPMLDRLIAWVGDNPGL